MGVMGGRAAIGNGAMGRLRDDPDGDGGGLPCPCPDGEGGGMTMGGRATPSLVGVLLRIADVILSARLPRGVGGAEGGCGANGGLPTPPCPPLSGDGGTIEGGGRDRGWGRPGAGGKPPMVGDGGGREGRGTPALAEPAAASAAAAAAGDV